MPVAFEDRQRPTTIPLGSGLVVGPVKTLRTSRGIETGMERWQEKEFVEVPGTRKWYPDLIETPTGVTEMFWTWKEGRDPDVNQMSLRLDVPWTPAEWQTKLILDNDDAIRSMDWTLVVTLYYSLAQWECRCGGNRTATMRPSVVSPSSLAGRCDVGATTYVEWHEQALRDRIWRLRPDLRSVRLPDGRVVQGLIDPRDRMFRAPECTSTFAIATQAFMAAVLAAAGTSALFAAVQQLVRLPTDLAELREAVRRGSLASQVTEFVRVGPGEAPPALEDRASGGGSTTRPAAIAGGSPVVILLAAAAAALMMLR
jgi:hypothetical protein